MESATEEQMRFTIRVPYETGERIVKYARDVGLKPTFFMSFALVIGAQWLSWVSDPKNVLDPESMAKFEALADRLRDGKTGS